MTITNSFTKITIPYYSDLNRATKSELSRELEKGPLSVENEQEWANAIKGLIINEILPELNQSRQKIDEAIDHAYKVSFHLDDVCATYAESIMSAPNTDNATLRKKIEEWKSKLEMANSTRDNYSTTCEHMINTWSMAEANTNTHNKAAIDLIFNLG